MSNKYSKAWAHIKTLKGSNFGNYYSQFNNSTLAFAEDEKVIDELVKKATPKKAIKDSPSQIRYVQTYKCPNCDGAFSGKVSQYCYHCGQRLEYEDDE